MAQKSTMRPATVLRPALLAAGLALASASGPILADTLVVDAATAARESAAERPSRGMTLATVERRWGEPESRSAAVGRPPITRWEYPGFVVFFEDQHVVHAVARAR
jgi:hypothetical protein